MSITRQQAGHLAALLRTLRPAWDELATINALGRLQHMDLADLAFGAVRTAQDPDARTPTALTWTGDERWQRTLPTHRPASPRPHEACPVDGHSGWAGNCGQCRSEEIAAIFDSGTSDEPAVDLEAIDRRVTYRRGATAARQAIRELAAAKNTQEPTHD